MQSVLVWQFHVHPVSSLQVKDGNVASGTLVPRRSLARTTGAVVRRQEPAGVSHQVKQRALAIVADPIETDQVRPVFGRREDTGRYVVMSSQVRQHDVEFDDAVFGSHRHVRVHGDGKGNAAGRFWVTPTRFSGRAPLSLISG